MRNIKILILGASNVGKTSLIQQLVFGPIFTGSLSRQPLPTIEDVYFANLEYISPDKNNLIRDDRLMFFDVAGIRQSIDIEQLRTYITFADEFLLVYSITERSTFNIVDTLKKIIDQNKGKRDHPVIVLGNKLDLDAKRQVSFDEALVWAKRENIKLFEVTSTERDTLSDFTRYLGSQFAATQNHSSSGFKLRRSKTNQSTSG